MNLYRILEIVATDVGGTASIVSAGWTTTASIKLFKHTVNSPEAVGLDARHGANVITPPAKPMSIAAACMLLIAIADAWLRSKT